MAETRIVNKIEYMEFKTLIENCKNKIKVNSHAYFRLNQMQRKIYKEEVLIETLSKEKPLLIGIQKNQNHVTFYSRKNGYLRMIFKIKKDKIEIITFYLMARMPKI